MEALDEKNGSEILIKINPIFRQQILLEPLSWYNRGQITINSQAADRKSNPQAPDLPRKAMSVKTLS